MFEHLSIEQQNLHHPRAVATFTILQKRVPHVIKDKREGFSTCGLLTQFRLLVSHMSQLVIRWFLAQFARDKFLLSHCC
jgi:predicted XRE-type DNA-binding protein